MTWAALAGASIGGMLFNAATGLSMAQLSVAHWAGRAADFLQKETMKEFNANIDTLMAVVKKEDGIFQVPLWE